jgi:SAM-dependent methyltransferase
VVRDGLLSTDEAIRALRADPACAAVVRESYFDEEVRASAERYAASEEFLAVAALLGPALKGAAVLEVGAGRGIGAWALVGAGAAYVAALEPLQSEYVGLSALQQLAAERPILPFSAFGEAVPMADESVDIVFCRQVLHHIHGLDEAMQECARVLRPGGTALFCREHVVDDAEQLAQFLAGHPIHKLTGDEHAHSLPTYRNAITGAGLQIVKELGPWDSIVNAFGNVRNDSELRRYAHNALRRRLGPLGAVLALVPGVLPAVWARIKRPAPGRLYSFLCRKA